MKRKKLFFSLMVVAIAATLSVGFTSCSKDDKKEEDPIKITPDYLMIKWFTPSHNKTFRNIEFKQGGTYFYEDQYRSIDGLYRITESKLTNIEQKFWNVDKVYLYKIQVSGSNDFDQLLVYYVLPDYIYKVIFVEFYLNDKIVEMDYYDSVSGNNMLFQYWRFINDVNGP